MLTNWICNCFFIFYSRIPTNIQKWAFIGCWYKCSLFKFPLKHFHIWLLTSRGDETPPHKTERWRTTSYADQNKVSQHVYFILSHAAFEAFHSAATEFQKGLEKPQLRLPKQKYYFTHCICLFSVWPHSMVTRLTSSHWQGNPLIKQMYFKKKSPGPYPKVFQIHYCIGLCLAYNRITHITNAYSLQHLECLSLFQRAAGLGHSISASLK